MELTRVSADLQALCDAFILSRERDDVAKAACHLLEKLVVCIQDGIPLDVTLALVTSIVACRVKSIASSVDKLKGWAASDPLTLIDGGPWDPLCLLLFLCECHLRICVGYLFKHHGGWPFQDKLSSDQLHEALWNHELRVVGPELRAGLEPKQIEEILKSNPLPRAATALAICFECHDSEKSESTSIFMQGGRVSRKGVRLLERAMLVDSLNIAIASEIITVQETNLQNPFEFAEIVQDWMRRTIDVDANNALLLRLDEWAMCCALDPNDVAFATGERGGVPQEHRNSPAAWVAQLSKSDADYRTLMAATKRNNEHVDNAYVCFAGMLEQHFGFEWSVRCFVARLNPTIALRKIREYKATARAKTPPLVVQRSNMHATVLSFHGRVECEGPEQALSAWISLVTFHEGGQFTRKANVRDIVIRMKSHNERSQESLPDSIGGASIAVIS